MPRTISLFDKLIETDVKAVTLIDQRCLRRRLNTNECRSCIDVCTTGALSFDGRMVQLDTDRCSRCMRCTAICPNEALVPPIDLEKTLRLLAERHEAVISCERHQLFQEDEITVPCFGIFSPIALMAIGSKGCATVRFRTEQCRHCVNKDAAEAFISALGRVTDHVARLFGATLTTSQSITRYRATGNERRSYLLGLRAKVLSMTPQKKHKQEENEPCPEQSGRRLPVGVRMAARMIDTAESGVKEQLRELCTPRLTISTTCAICPRCAGICPTGALKRDKSKRNKYLLFNADYCSGCRLCVLFCKQSSIRLSPATLLDNQQGTSSAPRPPPE